jgi:hypothetical protein
VPLRRDNALLGVITAYRQEVRPPFASVLLEVVSGGLLIN